MFYPHNLWDTVGSYFKMTWWMVSVGSFKRSFYACVLGTWGMGLSHSFFGKNVLGALALWEKADHFILWVSRPPLSINLTLLHFYSWIASRSINFGNLIIPVEKAEAQTTTELLMQKVRLSGYEHGLWKKRSTGLNPASATRRKYLIFSSLLGTLQDGEFTCLISGSEAEWDKAWSILYSTACYISLNC